MIIKVSEEEIDIVEGQYLDVKQKFKGININPNLDFINRNWRFLILKNQNLIKKMDLII